jgi:hypothetical protein
MSLFSKKDDLLSRRERELNADLARLEQEVQRLSKESPKPVKSPRPPEASGTAGKPFSAPLPAASAQGATPSGSSPHFNDRGVRKFDFLAFWNGLRNHLSGPTGNNPAMVRMLAAGSVHGLRQLRRERRVARNRFIFLFLTLLTILWGVVISYLRQR